MGRVHSYTLFFLILVLLMQMAGLGLGGSELLQLIGLGADGAVSDVVEGEMEFRFKDMSLWARIFAAGAVLSTLAVAGSTIVIGILGKAINEKFILLPFIAVTMVAFLDVVVGTLMKMKDFGEPWLVGTFLIIFLAVGVGYLITMIEWFAGGT